MGGEASGQNVRLGAVESVPQGHCTGQTLLSKPLKCDMQRRWKRRAESRGRVPETNRKRNTYVSESESSVSRLLATLFARPSESSLWYGWLMPGRLSSGTGGTGSSGSRKDRSSRLAEAEMDVSRFLRLLKSFDMRRRCDDEASLRPSSEFWRLLRRSVAPSVGLETTSSLLLAMDTVDEARPLEYDGGAARVPSLSLGGLRTEPMLLRRSCEAMGGGVREVQRAKLDALDE